MSEKTWRWSERQETGHITDIVRSSNIGGITAATPDYVNWLEAQITALTSERDEAVSQRETYEEEASRNKDIAEGWKARAATAEQERDEAVRVAGELRAAIEAGARKAKCLCPRTAHMVGTLEVWSRTTGWSSSCPVHNKDSLTASTGESSEPQKEIRE